MNPFLDKPPSELKAMLPDLSDPELDALCACVCNGEWVEENTDGEVSFWQMACLVGWTHLKKEIWCWTTMFRLSYFPPENAIRLLVKYELEVGPNGYCGKTGTFWESGPSLEDIRSDPGSLKPNPCRAITEAAVTVELTGAIEGDGR